MVLQPAVQNGNQKIQLAEKFSRLFALYSELYADEQVTLNLESDGSGQLAEWFKEEPILEWDDMSEAIEVLELWTGKKEA